MFGLGGKAGIPLGFPFVIKTCLSWEIQDRILLRERLKEHPSDTSVGRACKGSYRSIQRSTNQSEAEVNLAGKPFHV